MTRTLDLRKDLEAWYTFDDADFDNQRNHVRDRSGHGRHAEASGGPTMGVASPVGEAASLDGTDDYFDTGEVVGADNQTVFAIVKCDNLDGSWHQILNNQGSGEGFLFAKNEFDQFTFSIENGSGTRVATATSAVADEWVALAGWWDGSKLYIAVDGDLKNTTTETTHNQATTYNLHIGYSPRIAGEYWNGDIAAVGRWSRALSWAEIQQLNRLTGRKVNHL